MKTNTGTTQKASKELVESYREISVGDIGHILDAPNFMDIAIQSVYKDVKLVGPAFTACEEIDN